MNFKFFDLWTKFLKIIKKIILWKSFHIASISLPSGVLAVYCQLSFIDYLCFSLSSPLNILVDCWRHPAKHWFSSESLKYKNEHMEYFLLCYGIDSKKNALLLLLLIIIVVIDSRLKNVKWFFCYSFSGVLLFYYR